MSLISQNWVTIETSLNKKVAAVLGQDTAADNVMWYQGVHSYVSWWS